jgi:hypothetical protein
MPRVHGDGFIHIKDVNFIVHIAFDRNVAEDGFAYLPANDLMAGGQPEATTSEDNADFDQTVPDNDGFFNQESSW